LKTSAGILSHVAAVHIPALHPVVIARDVDLAAVPALIVHMLAEAQEIVLMRALRVKHSPVVIATLANHTAQRYADALPAIKTIRFDRAQKWMAYLRWKSVTLKALAEYHMGLSHEAKEECGLALAFLRSATTHATEAASLARTFDNQSPRIKGESAAASPQFVTLTAGIRSSLDKNERENGFIYHHKVPVNVPPIPGNSNPAAENPYMLPPVNERWTAEVYTGIDVSKLNPGAAAAASKTAKEGPAMPSASEPSKEEQCPVV
jgi:hypothetical protein